MLRTAFHVDGSTLQLTMLQWMAEDGVTSLNCRCVFRILGEQKVHSYTKLFFLDIISFNKQFSAVFQFRYIK